MDNSFKQGILIGVFAPLAFLAAVAVWIYRYTGRVPFATKRTKEGEVTLRLVDPEDVPGYWQGWRRELDPLITGIREFVDELRRQARGDLAAQREEMA